MVNPITDLRAGEFLLFYAVLIGVLTYLCRRWTRSLDATRMDAVPLAPARPDPYGIAYLKGGEEEVMKVAVAGLLHRRYLSRDTEAGETFVPAPNHSDLEKLTALELSVYEWFATPRKPLDLEQELRWNVASHCHPYEDKLRAEGMFRPEETRERTIAVQIAGTALIVIVGLARLAVGLMRDRPVGFLVGMTFIGVGVFLVATSSPRLSARGSSYLERLTNMARDRSTAPAWQLGTPDFLLLVATAGFAPLAGSEFACLQDVFQKSKGSQGGGGDGGGCGGGGCGGCGGCG